ncbi:TMEM165/GDT1 family protein [Arthrobacter sp. PL16]|uniref:TMEM165/GDT1 family protein n=1 Tax=Arthrobacter sp. PL16 TaxID=3071720 RepID=UPI003FA3A1C5
MNPGHEDGTAGGPADLRHSLVGLLNTTLLATLVLANRYRPWLVWLGVTMALTVQTASAIAFRRQSHGLGQSQVT